MTVNQTKPLKLDLVFADVDGELGMHWRNLNTLENRLAEKLYEHPVGTTVLLEQDAWYLKEAGDQLVLCYANYLDGDFSDEESRFDFGLEWVDVTEDELGDYIQRLERAINEFPIAFAI